MGEIWMLFGGQAINKLQICTVGEKKATNETEDGTHTIQISMSNGLVLEEFYPDEETAVAAFKKIVFGSPK